VVPVGEDQVSHVEFSRELVRKFNFHYGFRLNPVGPEHGKIYRALYDLVSRSGVSIGQPIRNSDELEAAVRIVASEIGHANLQQRAAEIPELHSVFAATSSVLEEPEAMLTLTPRVPGLDGRKMSKSYGNAITLSEADADIRAKTKVMVTDPARKRRTDPGNPDVCPVYDWHKLFAPKNAAGEYTAEGKATLEWSATGCRTAGIGCIECKAAMADNLIKWIAPVRERRVKYEQNPKQVLEILDAGSAKARESAKETMGRVREAVFHWEAKRAGL